MYKRQVLGWAFQRGVAHPVSRYDRPARVFSACAGAAIYRREVFEEIGYFDERHFAYLEDLDVGCLLYTSFRKRRPQ